MSREFKIIVATILLVPAWIFSFVLGPSSTFGLIFFNRKLIYFIPILLVFLSGIVNLILYILFIKRKLDSFFFSSIILSILIILYAIFI